MKSKIHDYQNNYLRMRKNAITLFITLLISVSSVAQGSPGINYKAVIKDDNGTIMANQYLKVKFAILNLGDTVDYEETHTTTTDANGIIILVIGYGTEDIMGSFFELDWASNLYRLKVDIDTAPYDVFIPLGTTFFEAVPMAKFADRAYSAVTAENVSTKIDDLSDGKSDADGSSLFIGQDAGLNDDGSNNENVGVGYLALTSNTTGVRNSAFGASALHSNIEGSYNTANGQIALYHNIDGSYNTASGSNALRFNTSGNNNTANGYRALLSNTEGSFNTATGNNALYHNIEGNSNTAIGNYALNFNTVGHNNTANGHGTLFANEIGDNNTALGSNALISNTTGDDNIALGRNAGNQNVSGNNNIFIGNETGSFTDESNKLYIDNGASDNPLIYGEFDTDLIRINGDFEVNDGSVGISTQNPISLFEIKHANVLPTPSNKTNALSITNSNTNNSFQLATHHNGSLTLYSNGNYLGYFNHSSGVYTVISDRRLKKDITALENGTLNKVMQLNPVSYLMKDQTSTKRNLGLISQEVQVVFPSITNYVKESDLLTLSYTELIPILIKAMQEQQAIIDGQQHTIEAQKTKDIIQDKSIQEQNKSIEALVARLNIIESKSTN